MGQFPRQITLTDEAARKIRALGNTSREDMTAYVCGLIMGHHEQLEAARVAARVAAEAAFEAERGFTSGMRFLKFFDIEIVEVAPGKWKWEHTAKVVKKTSYTEETTKTVTRSDLTYGARHAAVIYAIEKASDLYMAMEQRLKQMQDRKDAAADSIYFDMP